MNIFKQIGKILLVLVCAAVVLALLNWQFVYENLSYWIHPPQPQPVVVEVKKEIPNRLIIPSLSLDLPVVYINDTSDSTEQAALKNGVVHYPNTALPGAAGNVYIFGHSSDYVWVKSEYKTAFATLPHIQIGDEINISDADGNSFDYTVTDKKVVSPKDTSVLAQDNSLHILTLQTSYPVGTAINRYVVIAKLK